MLNNMQEYKYYINGEFKTSNQKIPVINPATGKEFACIFETPAPEVESAIKYSKVAQKQWKKTSFRERAKILRDISRIMVDNLSVLAELETREIGKCLKESLFVDISLGADCFNYYASFLDSLQEECAQSQWGIDLIKYDPFGVAGVYLPYNVPLMIFGFSCAGCLAAGNSLIIKPSERGSLSMLELSRHIDKLDIPRGLINIITGKGITAGKTLAESNIDIISFTGSRSTLKKIITQSAETPKKILCELGGCNPAVIFSNAKKEEALENLLGASFIKQGQMCIGTSVALIEESIYKDFLDDLVKRISTIKIGDPFDPATGIGPLPSRQHLDNVHKQVSKMKAAGAKIICGGEPLDRAGYFYAPTVIETNEIKYEEFFAPVILVKSFKNKEEVVSILEQNPTGLVLQLWTEDLNLAKEISEAVSYGTIWINTFAQMNSQTPFGGIGESGWGRNLGRAGFFEHVQIKHIGIGFKSSPVCGWFGV